MCFVGKHYAFRHLGSSYLLLDMHDATTSFCMMRVSGDKKTDIFTPFRSKLKRRLMQAFYFQPVSVVVEHLAKLGRHLNRFSSWQDGGW